MKEIKAIIQPFMLEKVVDALREIDGLPGCIVSQTTAYPKTRKQSHEERSLEPRSRAKLEIVVDDSMVDPVVSAIQKSAHTGNKGDGKIFVIECRDAIRIRTGERGKGAI